jgi:hypothetical protein
MNVTWIRATSALLLTVILGCREGVRLPTNPASPPTVPPPSAVGEVWLRGVVFDREQRCLPDAVLVIAVGRNTGAQAKNDCTRATQGYHLGYLFTGLRDGDVVTVRAAASSHVTKEADIRVEAGLDDQTHFNFFLDKQ